MREHAVWISFPIRLKLTNLSILLMYSVRFFRLLWLIFLFSGPEDLWSISPRYTPCFSLWPLYKYSSWSMLWRVNFFPETRPVWFTLAPMRKERLNGEYHIQVSSFAVNSAEFKWIKIKSYTWQLYSTKRWVKLSMSRTGKRVEF